MEVAFLQFIYQLEQRKENKRVKLFLNNIPKELQELYKEIRDENMKNKK